MRRCGSCRPRPASYATSWWRWSLGGRRPPGRPTKDETFERAPAGGWRQQAQIATGGCSSRAEPDPGNRAAAHAALGALRSRRVAIATPRGRKGPAARRARGLVRRGGPLLAPARPRWGSWPTVADRRAGTALVLRRRQRVVDRGEAAWRAGVAGRQERHLSYPGHGSWLRARLVPHRRAAAATDAPVADGCGSCFASIDPGPTGEIVEPGVATPGGSIAGW